MDWMKTVLRDYSAVVMVNVEDMGDKERLRLVEKMEANGYILYETSEACVAGGYGVYATFIED